MMYDVTLPGLPETIVRPCRGCDEDLWCGPLGRKFGKREMAAWQTALEEGAEAVAAFKQQHRNAEPGEGHGDKCPFKDLPSVILVQADTYATAQHWLQEMHDALG